MIATTLTGVRLLLVAPTAFAFARPDLIKPFLLLAFITVAIATDYFDGIAARRSGTASAAGQLFDHGTDFLFVTAGFAGAAYAGLVTPILPALITVAFLQYLLDSRFLHREKELRMSVIGRWNGILYFVPLVVLAAARLELFNDFTVALAETGRWLAWLLVLSTLVSIGDRALARRKRGREDS